MVGLGLVLEGSVNLVFDPEDKQVFRHQGRNTLPKPPTTTNYRLLHFGLMRPIYPTIPNKPMLFLVICLFSGSMTPVLSFVLS